jgi:hypothetical protein
MVGPWTVVVVVVPGDFAGVRVIRAAGVGSSFTIIDFGKPRLFLFWKVLVWFT